MERTELPGATRDRQRDGQRFEVVAVRLEIL
jgi:hypothetical protein